MHEILSLLTRYGYLILFLNLFLESIGLPLPGIPILLVAGAASAYGNLHLSKVMAMALVAIFLGDLLLYLAGRYSGWALLGFLCRLSANPETCILRSAESFYRRGRVTLIFSKFIPGINTMAPPMAGSLNMGLFQFAGLDMLSVFLYAGFFVGAGFFFSQIVARIVEGFYSLSRVGEAALLLGLVGFVVYRVRNHRKNRLYRFVPRITVESLAQKMADVDEAGKIVVADTRSHGYYDSGAKRIRGSVRLEPNNLPDEMHTLPKDKEIYLYCT